MAIITNRRIVAAGIYLPLLAIFVAILQSNYENYDILRNNRPLFFTLAFIVRIVAVLVGLLAVILALRVPQKNHTVYTKVIIILVPLIIVIISSFFYYRGLINDNPDYCLNQVRLHGILGDPCYLPL